MNTLDILATLIAQILLSQLGLSSLHLAAVVPLIAAFLAYARELDPNNLWNSLGELYVTAKNSIRADEYLTFYGINIIPIVVLVVLATPLIRKWYKNQYVTMIIQDPYFYSEFIFYIKVNKEKFSRMPSFVVGNADLIAYYKTEIVYDDADATKEYIEPGQIIHFKNTLFGTGYFKTYVKQVKCDTINFSNDRKSNRDQSTSSNINYPVYYCKLFIWRNSVNISNISHLQKLIKDDNYANNRKNTYFTNKNYKIYKPVKKVKKYKLVEITRHEIFTGYVTDQSDLQSIYMETYFSREKDRLWHLIKEIDQNNNYYRDYGQMPKLNLLLYGPPGTGKSTFAYRVAMCLQRDIVNLNITEYPSKYIVDKLMLGYITDESLVGPPIPGSRLVYVFDEFDRTIDYLIAAEKKEKQIFETKIKAMTVNPLAKLLGGDTKMSKKRGSPYESDDDDSSGLGGNSEEPESMPDIMTINDLLEIFQGVVDVKGRLIFAMTNHYEKMAAECPSLFRPGRLTPVYFGYIGIETLQDVVQYYFNQELADADIARLPTDDITIPTSEIIEHAMFNKPNDKMTASEGYNKFINWLVKRCDQPPPLIHLNESIKTEGLTH